MYEISEIMERVESLLNVFAHEEPFAIAEMDCGKLARLLQVDETTLRHRFKGSEYRSPASMIKDKKLLVAAILILDDPGKSVEEIANKAGFQCNQYFSGEFRKRFGIYPSEFKNRLQEKS